MKHESEENNMNNLQIKKVLDAHSIPNYIADDRIYADSMIGGTKEFEHVEDATGWSKEKLYQWLGY